MATIVSQLKANKTLMDPNFEGYKLSTNEIPTKKFTFLNVVDEVLPNDDEYSQILTELFNTHNHLIGDPFADKESVYFVDKNFAVNKIYLDRRNNDLVGPVKVWQIPRNRRRAPGDYNVSLKFLPAELVVLADGTGMLYILYAGEKDNDQKFTTRFCGKIEGIDVPFDIREAVLSLGDNDTQTLDLVLLSVKKGAPTVNPYERYTTMLHWITMTYRNSQWSQVALKRLATKGDVQYVALESGCESIYVVSDQECKFIVNPECTVYDHTFSDKKVYKWSQNPQEILVNVRLPDNPQTQLIKVTCKSTNLELKYNNEILISGELSRRVDPSLTSWRLNQNVLNLSIFKIEVGREWSEFIKNDPTGEYKMDTEDLDDTSSHDSDSDIDSEEEQVAVEVEVEDDEDMEEEMEVTHSRTDRNYEKPYGKKNFARINGSNNTITHLVNFDTERLHMVVLTADMSLDLPPAIGILDRFDVCIWQPKMIDGIFSMNHIFTLPALGQVHEVVGRGRSLNVCPPDLGYTAVRESRIDGRVSIYRQTNTKRFQSTTNIPGTGEKQSLRISKSGILGMYAFNTVLFLLTPKSITTLSYINILLCICYY